MFCFGHHTQTLCVRIWMLYQLSFSSDFESHLPLSLALLVMRNYHCHSNRNMEYGSNSSVLPHCSLNHNNLTSTGAIALARALQQNKSLEELKWVLNNTWCLYKFICSVRYMIISYHTYSSYFTDSLFVFTPCTNSAILFSTVLKEMKLVTLEPLHWLTLWEWTRAWKHWSKYLVLYTCSKIWVWVCVILVAVWSPSTAGH